ncbi:hypothetical protein I6A60_24600 [Frankia sp. AgB1.9]|uniref:tachylectin-related carbohydrate-binding protein n=1 Tax=unclassified Frankia TaxID=2632575 RepID=UPI00193319B1|nr:MULTISPECIES: tachylectin-related carbohydrate-binding protein [unclassified Frankia]MBL7490832.1 hypothetical protein [Frankia sp. AgW1.1]MBL7551021.1 hypothetical protein [Frankia sp. AgB1.9]MBL7621198.1 hypothetical protein [Frankia sp. AgB1.8]
MDDDEVKFAEGGIKMLVSLGGLAFAGVPTIAGVIGYVSTVVAFLNSGSTVDAVALLKQEVDSLKAEMVKLNERLDELIETVAIESNRNVQARVDDHLDDIKRLRLLLGDSPGDVNKAVDVANELGVVIDSFLRADLDLWRWTDVVQKDGLKALEPHRFKNAPTLAVYLLGLLSWLAARQVAVDANQRHRLDDDAPRILRHLQAVSVRPEFDKYAVGDASAPISITEHIKWRIRAWVIGLNRQPENRSCRWAFEVRDWMTGRRTLADHFEIITDSDHVLCTVDAASLGPPKTEIQMETDAGVDILNEMATTLDRVAKTGSVREPIIAPFPDTKVYPPAIFYIIGQNGDLYWYRNFSSSQPGGSTDWAGPTRVSDGWHRFTKAFCSGEGAVYGVQPDGTLLWYGHDGYRDGSPTWRGPRTVGSGWNGFREIFSGGEYVVYGIQPDGTLVWHKHNGAANGGDATTWSGPVPVGTGWQSFAKVLAAGHGIIFTIGTDGVLTRHEHRGYSTGTSDWGPQIPIGTGWSGFQEVVAGPDGVFYGFTPDGRILWHCYRGERPPPVFPPGGAGGYDPHIWEGPIEVKHGVLGFKSAFPVMEAPFRAPA